MKKKIVLIYDFDGVFYSGEHKFDIVYQEVEQNRRKFLPRLTDQQYQTILKEYPNWLEIKVGNQIVRALSELKKQFPDYEIDINDFWNWQQENIYTLVIDKEQVIDAKFIKKICKKYPVYLVSNSAPNHIYHYLKMFGCKPKWFREVISNRFEEQDPTKKHYYQYILDKENCLPQNAVVFGDSDLSDLEPARQLGIDNYFIQDTRDVPEITLKAINKILER